MNDARTAGLRRKYAATQEPAKRNELAALLRAAGFDPDAAETVSVAPKGRTAPKLQTTAQTTPQSKTAVAPAAPESKEDSKETVDKPIVRRRSVGRPRKTETSKENTDV